MSFLTSIAINGNKIRKIDQKLNNIEEQYLSYLINKETKYADIEKIEKKYISIIQEKNNKYNENKIILKKKKLEYRKILNDLEEELLNNYIMKNQLLFDFYKKSIEDITREIRMKIHEQDTYNNLYNRLYKTNILIKRKIEKEIKLEQIVLKQYNEYNMLKNHVFVSLKSQENMLNNMKNYKEKENEKFEENKIRKRNTINNLDVQIELIKNEVKSNEDKINKIKDIENKVIEKINLQKKTYGIIKRDIDWNRKDYIKNLIHINEILYYLKVNSINELIQTFNHIKEEYLDLHSQFRYYNFEISKLNNILTKQNIKLNDIQNQIKVKKKKIFEKKIDNFIIRRNESKIRSSKYDCNIILRNVENKCIILQKITNYMIKCISKISNEVFTNENNKEYSKIMLFDIDFNDFNKIKKITLYMIEIFQTFSNLFIKCIFSTFNHIIMINNKEFKNNEIYNLSNSNILNYYNNSLIRAKKEVDDKNKIKNKIELSNLKSNDNNNKNNEKEGISQNELYNNFIDYLYNEFLSLENSNKKKNNSENKNMKRNKTLMQFPDFMKTEKKENIPSLILHKNSSSLLNQSLNNFNSKTYSSLLNPKVFIKHHPKQIMKIIKKYQNDLVYSEKENKKKYNIPLLQLKKSILKKNNNKENNSLNYTFYQKNIKDELSHKSINFFSEEISEHSSEEFKENERKKKIELRKKILEENKNKIRSFKDNPEMALIYKRMNELHYLHLSYLRNKSNKVGDDSFKEIYFNFQRKYRNKYKIKLSNSNERLKKTEKRFFYKNYFLDSPKINFKKLHFNINNSQEIKIKNRSLSILNNK